MNYEIEPSTVLSSSLLLYNTSLTGTPLESLNCYPQNP